MARKRAGKIEAELGADACQELVAALAAEPNITLKRIQEIARERGIEVSLMGAKTFRDGPFESHLAKLAAARDLALKVAGIQEQNTGATLADAASAVIANIVFDELSSGAARVDEQGNIDLDTLSKVVARLRTGDQRGRLLEAKLREMEAKEAERKAKARELQAQMTKDKQGKQGLTRETLERIEELIGLL